MRGLLRLLPGVLIVTSLMLASAGCEKKHRSERELEYQRIADRIRLKQLKDFAQLIERFHAATGHYPLTKREGQQLPVEVAISRQPHEGPEPNASIEDLERELSEGLGEKIALERDPQVHDLEGYRQYHYSSDGKSYEVYAHLYHATPETEPIDEVTQRYRLKPGDGRAEKIPAWDDEDHEFMRAMDKIRARDAEKAKKK